MTVYDVESYRFKKHILISFIFVDINFCGIRKIQFGCYINVNNGSLKSEEINI